MIESVLVTIDNLRKTNGEVTIMLINTSKTTTTTTQKQSMKQILLQRNTK